MNWPVRWPSQCNARSRDAISAADVSYQRNMELAGRMLLTRMWMQSPALMAVRTGIVGERLRDLPVKAIACDPARINDAWEVAVHEAREGSEW